MAEIPQVISPDDICIESIDYIFSVAGLDSDAPGDGAVWLKKEDSIPLKIEICERDKMLKFQSSIGLSEYFPTLDKYQLANELNDALLVRFNVYTETCLVGEYYLSYENGLLTDQLILTCQLFQFIFIGAIRDKFVKGGVLDV